MDETQITNVLMDELVTVISAKGVITDLVILFIIFLGALGLTYLFGRMFGVVNSTRGRNGIAFSAMIIFTFVYVFVLGKPIPDWVTEGTILSNLYLSVSDISKLVILVLIEVLIYVLLGMRLYSRVDKVLDKKIGEDTIEVGQDEFADAYNKDKKKQLSKKTSNKK